MPDEEAFCVLVRMMSSYEMRGHYTPDMNMLQLRLYQYELLMEEQVPIIHKHFQNQGIRSTMYASQWFMTLFAYKFPLELVFRVYDIIFVEGIDSLLRFAIALLKANHDKILNHDFETLIEYLKNGLFEYYMVRTLNVLPKKKKRFLVAASSQHVMTSLFFCCFCRTTPACLSAMRMMSRLRPRS